MVRCGDSMGVPMIANSWREPIDYHACDKGVVLIEMMPPRPLDQRGAAQFRENAGRVVRLPLLRSEDAHDLRLRQTGSGRPNIDLVRCGDVQEFQDGHLEARGGLK